MKTKYSGKISIKKIKMIFLLILYKILLDFSYVYYINPMYEYMGFTYNLNYFKLIESYLFLVYITICLPIQENQPSNIALNTLNIVMIIPVLSIYALKNESRLYLYGVIVSFLITIFIVRAFPRFSVKVNFSMKKLLIFLFAINSILVYTAMFYFNGLPSLVLLDFNNVYKFRGNINYGYPIMKYLVNWQANIINPFLIVLNLENRNKVAFILVCFLQLLIYLLTSQKAYLFYPIVMIFIILFIKWKKFIISSIYGIITIIIGSLTIYYFKISLMIPSLFINRTLFLPAQISFQYYEYFSSNGFVLLSHSIFEKLFSEPPYTLHPIKIIGKVYYTNNWPNTGYLGDAFMNFGIFGMIVFSIILAIILIIIDSLSNSDIKKLISSVFIVLFMILLTNSALLTNLLTGGILLYMLILYLYLFEKQKHLKLSRK